MNFLLLCRKASRFSLFSLAQPLSRPSLGRERVYELVDDHRGDIFRTVYIVQIVDA